MTGALSRRAALSLSALVATPALGAGGIPHSRENPDAELIRLCAAYVEATDNYNGNLTYLEFEDDPAWQALEALERELDGLTAQTLAGVIAKARVAQSQARQPDGSEDYDTSFTGDWPEQVVRDLLAMAERGQA